MNLFYSIEADMRFERRPADARRIEEVSSAFGLAAVRAASEVIKDNLFSRIVVARCGEEDIVFRRAVHGARPQLERQAAICAALEGVRIVRPLRSRAGQFCHDNADGTWIAYRYVPGQLYCDERNSALAAIETALQCVSALSAWERGHLAEAAALPAMPRDSNRWNDLPTRLLDDNWRQALGEETAAIVSQAAPAIREIQRASASAASSHHGLTHADLQPANIVAGAEGSTVIDLEDICRDDVGLSAAHSIFKLARHAVFLGLMSVDRARTELCARGLDIARSLGTEIGSEEHARRLAARRTIDDISTILYRAEQPEMRWMLYDLRKKVHNLFELAELFGGPLVSREAVSA